MSLVFLLLALFRNGYLYQVNFVEQLHQQPVLSFDFPFLMIQVLVQYCH